MDAILPTKDMPRAVITSRGKHWLLRYRDAPGWLRGAIKTTGSALSFYSVLVLEFFLQDDLARLGLRPAIAKAILLGLPVVAFLVVVSLVNTYVDRLEQDRTLDFSRIQYAESLMDQYVAGEVARARLGPATSASDIVEAISTSDSRLQSLVQLAYMFFESQFAQATKYFERIEFEVTFMTRSYLDHKITIPAFANRNGRAPLSMLKRREDQGIYDRSVTARLYEAIRPEIQIIPDTSDPGANYEELYSRQRDRIRSMIVYPVRSHENTLLGTLVVHCDRKNFFLRTDDRFWCEILEIFSKRLALEKMRLDLLATETVRRTLFGQDPPALPF